jgi:phage terminase large subunit
MTHSLPTFLEQQAYLYKLEKAKHLNLASSFTALPWQVAPLADESPVILLSGSAGGGKSKLAGEKAHRFCLRYPGATYAMVRKTRQSMVNTTLLFMRASVLNQAIERKIVRHVESKDRFEYANGSILAYGGMHGEAEREAIRGIGRDGGLDGVLIDEATRLEESDYSELQARMRGTAAHYRQIILATNPGAPTHWINRRLILGGEAKVYYSGALDNPYNPPDYIARLQQLTGILRLRLLEGKWVQAEGVIYDNFSLENVTEGADYDPSRSVVWGVDDGYVYGEGPGSVSFHPRVILFGQDRGDGGINIFDEYYQAGQMSEQTISDAVSRGYEMPDFAYVDSSAAELKARLWNAGIQTVGATHRVEEGIKNVRRLLCDGNDVRLIRIHPRCVNLIRELQSYQYAPGGSALNGEPKPMKVDDHAADALRYVTYRLRFNQG